MYIMFRLIALIMMFLSAQFVNAAEEPDAAKEPTDTALAPVYPAWPERPVERNVVPPPPPGPYMSTALTYSGQGFSCCPGSENDEASEAEQVRSPLFKNMQWPERRVSPRPWVPESGEYSYAPEDPFTPRAAQADPYGYPPRQAWQPMYPPPPRPYRY